MFKSNYYLNYEQQIILIFIFRNNKIFKINPSYNQFNKKIGGLDITFSQVNPDLA